MDGMVSEFLRLFTDLDALLTEIVSAHGVWIYALLFVIVFCETGLVVTPFLPGDSLLFAVGALCARPSEDGTLLSLPVAMATIFIAGVLGDTVNYHAGRWIGPAAFSGKYRWLRQDYLRKAHEFFERHGGKSIVLARFVPIVRTFAPFVAGVGTMRYGRFLAYNLAGAGLWVGLICGAGYLFGELPVVKRNLSLVVGGIVAVSLLPLAIAWWRARSAAR